MAFTGAAPPVLLKKYLRQDLAVTENVRIFAPALAIPPAQAQSVLNHGNIH
jgi:hypothetical protein